MTTIFNRNDIPNHLINIPELDFSDDLFAERLGGSWFRLGAWTIISHRDERSVEDVVERQSFLLAPEQFADIFDKLKEVGNVFRNLGKPAGSVLQNGDEKEYRYAPFHRFDLPFASVVGEPLVFVHSTTEDVQLFINPDLWLFFELVERTPGCGIWWDPRRGVDAILQSVIDEGNIKIVEIRVDYLLKYLRARQLSLVIGHYRGLQLFNPSKITIERFVAGEEILGSPEIGAKVILQNGGLSNDIMSNVPYLQRRLHLWFEIKPPEINVDDPWKEQPTFDPYVFTLPTRVGPVAPARWKNTQEDESHNFKGMKCDFMDQVYFRQEVLMKYESASGFDIKDNGSISCRHYWGLVRSTARIGNELLATAIGDFAEGIPFEEWLHWQQYAVEPPSIETIKMLKQEQTVSDAVNCMVNSLHTLNDSFVIMANSFGIKSRPGTARGRTKLTI